MEDFLDDPKDYWRHAGGVCLPQEYEYTASCYRRGYIDFRVVVVAFYMAKGADLKTYNLSLNTDAQARRLARRWAS